MTVEPQSAWTVDTLRHLLENQIEALQGMFRSQMSDLRTMLDERYATQTRAVDAAFLAQSTAMTTALAAAKDAVETALKAQEKAVEKAEEAAEKRFEAFRLESLLRIKEVDDKMDTETARISERVGKLELNLTSRLDLNKGADTGAAEAQTTHRLTLGIIIAAAAILATLIAGGLGALIVKLLGG